MIFISVGTEKFPFDRLLKIVDHAIAEKKIGMPVFAQTGTCSYIPEHYDYAHFLSFDEMVAKITQAQIVITHAGIGSTLLCLNLGKRPIVFPRLLKYKEHLDDHQLEFTKKMESSDSVLIAYTEEDLIGLVNNYRHNSHDLSKSHSSLKTQLIECLKQICFPPSVER